MCASFAVAPRTAKVMATVPGKRLVKMEEALNLQVEDPDRTRVCRRERSAPGSQAGAKNSSKGSPEPVTTFTPFLHGVIIIVLCYY